MPWSRRHGGSPSAIYEVWVRDAHDGMVSDLSMVFKDSAEAQAYADKVKGMGDYTTSIRPSSRPMPMGRDRMSLRESGVKY